MVEGSFVFSLPEIRCVVLGVALVTDERHTSEQETVLIFQVFFFIKVLQVVGICFLKFF